MGLFKFQRTKKESSESMDKSKQFETILLKHHIETNNIKFANEIVEKFISKRRLIIYGGTSVDFAARLKGSKIYPDDILPYTDYDFLSHESVQDAYELALILYQAELPNVSAFMARHGRTMRVSMGGHIVADISWCPKYLFNKIPTKEFPAASNPELKLRFTAPEFQIVDQHLSLSFPFSNPPLEVVTGRANKDIKRFNILYDLWIEDMPNRLELEQYKTRLKMTNYNIAARCKKNNVDMTQCMFLGFIAYALLKKSFSTGLQITFDGETLSLLTDCEIPIECCIANSDNPTHNRFLDYYPESRVTDMVIYQPTNTLFPMMQTDGFKHCCIQYVLSHFSLQANLWADTPNIAKLYWSYYFDALSLVDKLPPFGTDIWPSPNEPNINDTTELWSMLTLANIADLKAGKMPGTEGSQTAKINDYRPKNFIPEMTPESRIDSFMDWRYKGPIFETDGKKKKDGP